jgi:hypothetical protein
LKLFYGQNSIIKSPISVSPTADEEATIYRFSFPSILNEKIFPVDYLSVITLVKDARHVYMIGRGKFLPATCIMDRLNVVLSGKLKTDKV